MYGSAFVLTINIGKSVLVKSGSMCNYTTYFKSSMVESAIVGAKSRKPHPPNIEIGRIIMLQIVQHLH